MRKVVLAGGSGFLGQRLERYFRGRNWKVIVLSRFPRRPNHVKWDGIAADSRYKTLDESIREPVELPE